MSNLGGLADLWLRRHEAPRTSIAFAERFHCETVTAEEASGEAGLQCDRDRLERRRNGSHLLGLGRDFLELGLFHARRCAVDGTCAAAALKTTTLLRLEIDLCLDVE